MSLESIDEDNERASCEPEVLHVYPLREEWKLGGQQVSEVFEDLLERALGTGLTLDNTCKEMHLIEEGGTGRLGETLA
jgi:hypothetical protein